MVNDLHGIRFICSWVIRYSFFLRIVIILNYRFSVTNKSITNIKIPYQCASNQFSPIPIPVSILTAIGMALHINSSTLAFKNSTSER